MLHINSSRKTLHYEAGLSQTVQDYRLVACALEAVLDCFTNLFTAQTTKLMHISAGEQASSGIYENLIHIKAIEESTLLKGLESERKKKNHHFKLKTFAT